MGQPGGPVKRMTIMLDAAFWWAVGWISGRMMGRWSERRAYRRYHK